MVTVIGVLKFNQMILLTSFRFPQGQERHGIDFLISLHANLFRPKNIRFVSYFGIIVWPINKTDL